MDLENRIKHMTSLAMDALQLWGYSSPRLQLVKMRENTVFSVTLSDGKRAALRIHRYGYHTNKALISELRWMEALNQKGIQVPRVIRLPSGNLYTEVTTTDIKHTLQVDMVEWLPGNPVGSLEEGLSASISNISETFEKIGKLIATLHNHATTWKYPDGFVRHAWDVNGFTGPNPLWGQFWDIPELTIDQKNLMLKAREVARIDLLSIGRHRELYGLIHSDLNLDNMLFDGVNISAIDFDDCGFGWYLFDLATVSILFHGHSDFSEITQSVIKGYRTVRNLSEQSIQQMPLFYLLRIFTYVGWIHTRRDTLTAQTQGQRIINLACNLAENYLSSHHGDKD
jgi:Ser/Thr protein kinase RdoA (MazF antagonist)